MRIDGHEGREEFLDFGLQNSVQVCFGPVWGWRFEVISYEDFEGLLDTSRLTLGSRFTCKMPLGQAIGRPGDLQRLSLDMVSEKNLMTRGPQPVKNNLMTITIQPLYANHPFLGTHVSQVSCILL